MFITFEGIDASGKSSTLKEIQTRLLVDFPNINIVLTREPGGANSREAERIREIILDKESKLSVWSEALLYSTSRRIHLETVVWPAMEKNMLILCDRYVDSFYAYQGFGRQIGLEKVQELTKLITENTMPNLTFYFEISVEKSIERKYYSRKNFDRMDNLKKEVYERVEVGYKTLIAQDPDRFVIINAEQDKETMVNEAYNALTKHPLFLEYVNENQ